MNELIGPDEEAFLGSTARTFLLATRSDGSPTGWPMTGLYAGGGILEFSTYGRSQKVVNLTRNPQACVVVAPRDSDRALVLRGEAVVAEAQREPAVMERAAAASLPTADGIRERARDRMLSGKRVVLRFTPNTAQFVPGAEP